MRPGAVIIPDVPIGLPSAHVDFLKRVKEALEILQGVHGRAPETRRAPTLAEVSLLVDRGDYAAWDYSQTSLVCDDTWKTGAAAMDFSGIVPQDARWILLHFYRANGSANYFGVRPIGATNARMWIYTNGSIGSLEEQWLVPCDASRRIEYRGQAAWSTMYIRVDGWVI